MSEMLNWRPVREFWFPPDLDREGAAAHRGRFLWWLGGGANRELPLFAPVLEEARKGRLDGWAESPMGRLTLIVVLDQFPRGLHAGTPDAYAADRRALRLAEDGLRLGHYDALARPWERTFFFMPLAHAEGVGHVERLCRVVALARSVAREAPPHLRPIYEFSARQARANLDVIARFGRFPHRNDVLGRVSTPEERGYLEGGDLVHRRQPPPVPNSRPSQAGRSAASA